MEKIGVYLEAGKKRTIAGAVEWPGWYRMGRDEATALQSLFESAPRYSKIISAARLDFQPPADAADLQVVERHEGNATTDFGAPGVIPSVDMKPLDTASLLFMQELLQACWQAFDAAVAGAQGKDMLKGPRGGGRDLHGIVRHVLDSEKSYLGRLGVKLPKDIESEGSAENPVRRRFILEVLASKAALESPGQGPRGGQRWMPRYFVRSAAYHLVDHIWEIEDRTIG